MGPIDYSINLDPSASNSGIFDYFQELKGLKKQRDAEELALQRKAEFDPLFNDLMDNYSTEKAAKLNSRFPEYGAQFKTLLPLEGIQKKQALAQVAGINNAFKAGKTEVGLERLGSLAKGHRDRGEDVMADFYEGIRQDFIDSPDQAEILLDQFNLFNNPEMIKQEAELMKTREEAKKLGEEADVISDELKLSQDELDFKKKELDLDQEKLSSLSEKQMEGVNTAINDSVSAQARADESLNLAEEIKGAAIGGGIAGQAWSGLKKLAGYEGLAERLKARYSALKSKSLIERLPPGVASDTDIKLIEKGFPSENSNVETLVDFLKANARIERLASINNELKSKWINENRFLGKSKAPVQLGEFGASKKGENFNDFMKRNRASINDKVQNEIDSRFKTEDVDQTEVTPSGNIDMGDNFRIIGGPQ